MLCSSNLIYYSLASPDATVSLERTFYRVDEDVGVVEVCVFVHNPNNINCPISFPFNIKFFLSDNTSGNDFYEENKNCKILGREYR